jgi:hypothetical protein
LTLNRASWREECLLIEGELVNGLVQYDALSGADLGPASANGTVYTADQYTIATGCNDTASPIVPDFEPVCNEETGFFDLITIFYQDGVEVNRITEATTLRCLPDVAPVVTTDIDYVCEDGAEFYTQIVTETVDGVVQAPVTSATSLPCVEPAPDHERNVDYLCDQVSGFFIKITEDTIDGVAQPEIQEPTAFPCVQQEAPDIELRKFCDPLTGTIQQAAVAYEGTAIETVISTFDTGIECNKKPADCVKGASTVVFLDNTFTRFNEDYTFEFENADGTTTQIMVAATAGWTAQVDAITAAVAAAYPTSVSESRCNRPGGCGGLLAPPADAQPSGAIFARYTSMLFCPTDPKIPVKATIVDSSNAARIGTTLTLELITTPETRYQICRECGTEGELQFIDGTPVPAADIPACVFECSESIPEAPPAACSTQFDSGCDQLPDGSTVDVIRGYKICEGDELPTITYHVEDDGALVDYNDGNGLVGGFLLDCATGDPIPEPEPECVVACVPCQEGSETGEPVVHQIQDDNTDFSYSYNDDTLKLQGQSPFNSPDAQPFFDAIIACIESGGEAEITFTDQDGNQGVFTANEILDNNGSSGAFGGVGDTSLVQSGKVRTAVTVCSTGAGDVKGSELVTVCGLDELLEKLCLIESNTSPATQIQVLNLCDDVDGDPANFVPVFVQYTIVQGQPLLTEIFSDVALSTPYEIQGILVDCATGEPVDPPAPICSIEDALVPCEGSEALCAHALGGLPVGGTFDISEGGIDWTICGTTYNVGPGVYSWAEMAAAITAASGVQATVVATDPTEAIVISATCCEAGDVQFQIGDDPAVVLARVPELDSAATEGEGCSLTTTGKNDDRRDDKLDEIIGLLGQLVECMCGDCPEDEAPLLTQRCQSYGNPLASGYNNWGDPLEVPDLADEFGITPTANEMWVRIVEFDCGGTSQPQVGQVFGPYTPGAGAADQFFTDLGAAISGTCLAIAPGTGTGAGGSSNVAVDHDPAVDTTLVIQEGVTVGAGPQWFSSAQGFVSRAGVQGDFIESTGVGATSNYAAESDPNNLQSFTEADSCEAI